MTDKKVENVEKVGKVKTTEKAVFKFKVKKIVTREVLQTKINVPEYIRIEESHYLGEEMDDPFNKGKKSRATLMHVVNLQTGESQVVVCNTVLHETLDSTYPEGSYIGLCFSITKLKKKEDKNYHNFAIIEIFDPSDPSDPSEVK